MRLGTSLLTKQKFEALFISFFDIRTFWGKIREWWLNAVFNLIYWSRIILFEIMNCVWFYQARKLIPFLFFSCLYIFYDLKTFLFHLKSFLLLNLHLLDSTLIRISTKRVIILLFFFFLVKLLVWSQVALINAHKLELICKIFLWFDFFLDIVFWMNRAYFRKQCSGLWSSFTVFLGLNSVQLL